VCAAQSCVFTWLDWWLERWVQVMNPRFITLGDE
jgi:hypothetical protein